MLFVDVAIVGGGFVLGRWLVRRLRRRDSEADPAAPDPKGPPQPVTPPFEGLPFKLGDVILRRVEGDEAWLAGALVFSEERPVAALFVAPEAGGDRGIWVRHAPGTEASSVTWLMPVAKEQLPGLVQTGEPPYSLEHAGVRYERVRRLPAKVARYGSGAPSVGASAIVAEYAAAGTERLLVVAGETMLAWQGHVMSEHEYEVLPGDSPAS
jgi:hypothetical protein